MDVFSNFESQIACERDSNLNQSRHRAGVVKRCYVIIEPISRQDLLDVNMLFSAHVCYLLSDLPVGSIYYSDHDFAGYLLPEGMVQEEFACVPEDAPSPTPDSPASISSQHIYPHSVPTVKPAWASPSSLHLRPVTDDDLEHIVFPPDERFDIVDGLLEWNRMTMGTTKPQGLPELDASLFKLDDEYRTAQGKVQQIKAYIDGAQEGKRLVDLLHKHKSASPTSFRRIHLHQASEFVVC